MITKHTAGRAGLDFGLINPVATILITVGSFLS
jgi:hypothetical protein